MMAKKFIVVAVVLAVLTLMITACFIESDPTDITGNPDPWGTPPYTGDVDATVSSVYNGSVKVVVTLKNGLITNVVITAVDKSLASGLIAQAPGLIVKANAFTIDALSSSTLAYTKQAIIDAGIAALNKIEGVDL